MTDKQKKYTQHLAKVKAVKNTLPIPDTYEYHKSGIYVYERTDVYDIKWFYCGQAKDIYKRAVEHAMLYDHLGNSLRKRGYKDESNPFGWEFRIIEYCDEEHLDDLEHYYIINFMRQGKQAYNVTSGKQGQGKTTFDTQKPSRGYNDGVLHGKKVVVKQIKHLFDLHLKAVYKADKPSKNAEKAMQKFMEMIGDKAEVDNENRN